MRRRALAAILGFLLGALAMPAEVGATVSAGCAPSPMFVDVPKIAARVRLDDARVMPDGSLLAVGVRGTSANSTLVSLHGEPGAWSWTTTSIETTTTLGVQAASVTGPTSDDAWAIAHRTPLDVVAHWDGTSWAVGDQPPAPADLGENDAFELIDIASAGETVWVVGWVSRFLGPGDFITRPYAGLWNGSVWTRTPLPRPATNRIELMSVSGSRADDVWTVGLADPGVAPLVEHWDGEAWSIVSTPGDSNFFAYLSSVDAASPSLAWTIGPFERGAFSWDGASLTRHPGAGYGVSVSGPDDVWNGGQGYWYTQHWDGDRWVPISMPQRANARIDEEMFDVEATRGGDQTFFVGSGSLFNRTFPLVARMCPWDVTDAGLPGEIVSVRADAPSILWRFPPSNTSSSRLIDLSDLHLFDTGARPPGSTFAWQYPGVGSYPFRVHPSGTTAVVTVPVGVRYYPGPGVVRLFLGPDFEGFGDPRDFECEVQVKKQGSTAFETIPNLDGRICTSMTWPVPGPGTYVFRGRSFDPVSADSSAWSPTSSITIGT